MINPSLNKQTTTIQVVISLMRQIRVEINPSNYSNNRLMRREVSHHSQVNIVKVVLKLLCIYRVIISNQALQQLVQGSVKEIQG